MLIKQLNPNAERSYNEGTLKPTFTVHLPYTYTMPLRNPLIRDSKPLNFLYVSNLFTADNAAIFYFDPFNHQTFGPLRLGPFRDGYMIYLKSPLN